MNILILPHAVPDRKLKGRTIEIAKELAKDKNLKVYILERAHVYEDLTYGLKNFLKRCFICKEKNNLIFVKVPYIPSLTIPFLSYNQKLLQELLAKLDIKVLINNFSHSFSIPESRNFVYVYDYVDDYVAFHKNPLVKKLMDRFIKKEVEKCDLLTVGTYSLGERIKKKGWKKDFMWLISGVSQTSFQNLNLDELNWIREKYNLNEKFVIGHIGYHDEKSGTEFLIDVFKKALHRISNMVLLIVGPGPEIVRLKKKYGDERNIIFTGAVDPEKVNLYFLLSDVGTLPYIEHPSVHARFPVRLLDFIAARKIVISWPFGDLKLLNLPNVILVERDVDKWVEAIVKAKELKWKTEWDYLFEELSTAKIVNNLKNRIFEVLEKINNEKVGEIEKK